MIRLSSFKPSRRTEALEEIREILIGVSKRDLNEPDGFNVTLVAIGRIEQALRRAGI